MKGVQSKVEGGFTMVELVMVMSLIGIMAFFALPKLTQVMSVQSSGFKDQVKATIDYARKIAVAQRRHVCVSIAATSVTVTSDRGLPVNHTNGTCASALPLPSGSNVVTAPARVTLSPVVLLDFDAEGRPVMGAPVTITMTDASVSQVSTLTVEAESGYVH